MPIWQLCANLLIPNCLRSNLSYSPLAALELYVNMATTNAYKEGGKDNWSEIGRVKASTGRFVVDLGKYPSSKFYKFVVKTPTTSLTRWLQK